jgi:hypothetical protein
LLKRILVVFSLLACGALPAKGQQPGSPEAVKAANELMAVLGPDMIEQMSAAMIAQMWPQMEKAWSGKVDVATSAELRLEFERVTIKFLTESIKDAPGLYAKYLSAQELRDIAAFYRTPSGLKALRVMPKVMPEFMSTLMPKLASFEREIAVSMEYVLRKHGIQK